MNKGNKKKKNKLNNLLTRKQKKKLHMTNKRKERNFININILKETVKKSKITAETYDIVKNSELIKVPETFCLPIPPYIKDLKISPYLPSILYSVFLNQITEVNAGTGTGKTVGISRYVLEGIFLNLFGNFDTIFVSIPTIANTMFQYDYAITNNENINNLIGYAYSGIKSQNFYESKLIYTTTQTLLNYLKLLKKNNSEKLEKIIIMIDETHHPSMENYMIMGFCNWMIKTGHKNKIIIATATPCDHSFEELKSKVISIGETQYPVTIHWHDKDYFGIKKTDMNSFNKQILENIAILKIEQVFNSYTGDILVITSGENEVETLCARIKEVIKSNIIVYPLYSALPENEIRQVAKSSNQRKIIVATNIAETGITISGVTCVINMMTHKKVAVKSNGRVRIIEEVLISKASFKQRGGRAGRTQPGHHFPLCTKKLYEKLPEFIENEFNLVQKHIPVISFLASKLPAKEILLIKSSEYKKIEQDLENMKLIEKNQDQVIVTFLGKKVARYPLSLRSTISLLEAVKINKADFSLELLNFMLAVILIDVRMSSPNIFYVPPSKRKNKTEFIKSGKYDIFEASNDITVLIKIFCSMMIKSFDEQSQKVFYLNWCKKKFINIKFIDATYRLFYQVWNILFGDTLVLIDYFTQILQNCENYVPEMVSIFSKIYHDSKYYLREKEKKKKKAKKDKNNDKKIAYVKIDEKEDNIYTVDKQSICTIWQNPPNMILSLCETQIKVQNRKPLLLLGLCMGLS